MIKRLDLDLQSTETDSSVQIAPLLSCCCKFAQRPLLVCTLESVSVLCKSKSRRFIMRIDHSGYPSILQRVKDAGFATFESQDYDMNIIGERNPNGTVNAFDDWIHLCFLEGGVWQWHAYKCTTDAGKYWLEHANTRGTAILAHNRQYRGAYQFGLHRGQYRALVQTGNEVCV